MFLQNLAAPVDGFEAREGLRAAAIVAAQVGRGLFALEDHGVAERAISLRAIGGDVGAVTALREGDFERRDRIAVFLRPKEGEAFEFEVRGGFARLAGLKLGGRSACPVWCALTRRQAERSSLTPNDASIPPAPAPNR